MNCLVYGMAEIEEWSNKLPQNQEILNLGYIECKLLFVFKGQFCLELVD